MPLTAVLDGRPIFIFDHDARSFADVASLVKRRRQALRCKDCSHSMTVVMPARRSSHFRHLAGAPADCRFVVARESDAHHELKRRIYGMCRALGWDAKVEWCVPGTNRRADVWTRDHLGRQFTFEVQLSAIPDDTSYARSVDHIQAGITPVWLIDGDLRAPAFPDDAKRVRLQRHGEWVLTGHGDVKRDEDLGWVSDGPAASHSRKTRVLGLSTLLPLLDSPARTPVARRETQHRGLPPAAASTTPLALPGPAASATNNKGGSVQLLGEWARHKRLGRLNRARSMNRQLRVDRAAIIDRLRTLAAVLADARVADAFRFRQMTELPLADWTRKHYTTALAEIWSYRFWLRDLGWQPFCGGCGLALDEALIQSGVHVGCYRPN
ncbi:competence protein CoiA family protein [Nocardioides sp. NBC_00368]|uniref:competence protein CoiA family protein n=1 Tax=Nocardioides sp. NBC_00368 TaxID=2976000 RepID=UPI002E1D466B